MSVPEKMACLLDVCRSPLACAGVGYCRERDVQSVREYAQALAACRERGIADPFKRKVAE